MTFRKYIKTGEKLPKFTAKSVQMIERVNAIIADYQNRGFSLTLRQVYYQAVSRGWIENAQREYKNLGGLINNARHAGLISWTAIEDRTRHLRMSDGIEQTPEEFIAGDADAFRLNYWNTQPYHVECWVEKDALVDVLRNACGPLKVPYYSCRGYTSATELWRAGQRLGRKVREGKEVVIIHLGGSSRTMPPSSAKNRWRTSSGTMAGAAATRPIAASRPKKARRVSVTVR